MIEKSLRKTLVAAAFVLLALPYVRADESSPLTPGQRFFFETVEGRRSVRSYKSDMISDDHLLKILNAARMAATSGNQQPWKFLVIRDQQKKEAMKKACLERGMTRIKADAALDEAQRREKAKKLQEYYDTCFTAPLFVVVLVDRQAEYPDYNHFDGPMAAANLMLAARALGYGTVFYTDTIPDEVTRQVLRIPERYERVCITPIGIPTEWPKTPPKKDLSEFIVYESFSER
ncbi:MAG: nitroreductase family protein [Candidatus Aminicenantales bacterium]